MILGKLPEPYYWEKHDLWVTHDGFHENGLRIHLIDLTDLLGCTPHIRDNALVCPNTMKTKEILKWVDYFTQEQNK